MGKLEDKVHAALLFEARKGLGKTRERISHLLGAKTDDEKRRCAEEINASIYQAILIMSAVIDSTPGADEAMRGHIAQIQAGVRLMAGSIWRPDY